VEEEGFIRAVREAPHDEAVRLIYADWLDERSDARAGFLRLECDLRRVSGGDPAYAAALARWLEWRPRLPADWLEGLGWRVNGLPLPRALVDLMAGGRWPHPDTASRVQRLFPEWSYFYPYPFETMRSETVLYPFETGPMWLGKPDPERPPGDLDMSLAVIIADLGHGSDQPFALDYRASLEHPRLLILQWDAYDHDPTVPRGDQNRWMEVAPSFQAFAEWIGV
jgi:uncharacterized protein (TIGR02996 family)